VAEVQLLILLLPVNFLLAPPLLLQPMHQEINHQ
jgi:hypothetical protein